MSRHHTGSSRRRRQRWLDGLEYPIPCVYCGVPLNRATATVDHIVPVSKGGLDDRRNFATACFRCNNGKRDTVLCPVQRMLVKARLRGHTAKPFHKLGVKPQKRPKGLRSIGGEFDEGDLP